ncbi:MAG: DUF3638 domain-containing protein [Oligoflexales bacterium]|nr:DUF3638 domain-containing protein [Oligoflexales bacterium]
MLKKLFINLSLHLPFLCLSTIALGETRNSVDQPWLEELSADELKAITPPEVIQGLVAKMNRRSIQNSNITPDDIRKMTAFETQQCLANYQEQWEKTQTIVDELKKTNCWNSEHLSEIIKEENSLQSMFRNLERNGEMLRNMGKTYNNIQNLISYCRSKTYLNDPDLAAVQSTEEHSDQTLADRMLLHMLGDVFGKNSDLEGNVIGSALVTRHALYKKLDKTLAKNTYIASKRQAEPCYDFNLPSDIDIGQAPYPDLTKVQIQTLIKNSETAIQLTNAYASGSFSIFEPAFKKAIKEKLKEKGDEIYFQGGWVGHAVVWSVTQETASNEGKTTYTFRVYNSGEGADQHFALDGMDRILPYFEKIHVSYPSLSSKGFLRLLLDLNSFSKENTAGDESSYFYQAVAFILDGRMATKIPDYEDFLDPQLSGTCSYYSVPFYFQGSAEDKLFAEFLEFHVQFKFIDEYIELNKERISKFPPPYDLTKKSLRYFSETVARAAEKEKSAIDEGLHLLVSEKLDKYHSMLLEAFQKMQETAQKMADKERKGTDSKAASFQPPRYQLGIPLGRQSASEASVPPVLLNEWEPEPATVRKNLTKTLEFLGDSFFGVEFAKRSHESFSQTLALQTIQDLALKLPLNKSFWDQLSARDLSACLYLLRKLSEYYLNSVLDHIAFSQREGLTPTQALIQLKILTLADQILQILKVKAPELTIASIPSLFNKSFNEILNGKLTLFAIHDARWNLEFEKISSYWKGDKINDKFFNNFSDSANKVCTVYFENKEQEKSYANILKTKCRTKEIGYGEDQEGFNVSQWRKSFIEKLGTPQKFVLAISNAMSLNTFSFGVESLPEILEAMLPNGAFNSRLIVDLIATAVLIPTVSRIGLPWWFTLAPLAKNLVWDPAKEYGLVLSLLHESYLNYAIVGHQFYDLRSIAFVTNYFFQGHFDITTAKDLTQSAWETLERNDLQHLRLGIAFMHKYTRSAVEVNCSLNINHPIWECYTLLFGRSLPNPKQIDSEKLQFHEEKLSTTEEPVAISDYGKSHRTRKTTDALIVAHPKERKITFDSFRQLGYISGDRDTQIAQSFGYFKENPYLLRDKDYQSLFKKLMFDPGLLAEEARKNPSLSQQLGKFCQERFESAKESSDLLLSMYYLRLNQFFAEQMRLLHRKEQIAFQEEDFLDSRKELILTIKTQAKDSNIKSSLYRDLIRTYLFQAEFNNDEDLAWFLIAHAYRRMHAEPIYAFEADIDDEIFGMLLGKQAAIKRRLEKSTASLDRLFIEFGVPIKNGKWEIDYPDYTYKQDGIEGKLNIATAKFSLSGWTLAPGLPQGIVHDPYFQSIIPNIPEIVLKLGDFYEFQRDGTCYRTSQSHGKVIVSRKWGDVWYQHIRNKDAIDLATKPTDLPERLKNTYAHESTLFPGYSHWIAVRGEFDRQGLCPGRAAEAYIGQSLRQENAYEMVAFKNLEETPEMSLKLNRSSRDIENILKISKNKCAYSASPSTCNPYKLTDYTLHPIEGDPRFAFLGDFEHLRYVLVWTSEKNDEIDIDLPRLNLSFKYNKNKKILLSDEYGVLDSAILPHLPFDKNYLSFLKEKDRYILIPQFRMQHIKEKNGLSLNMVPDFEIQKFKNSERKYFALRENSTIKEIITYSNSAKLYLAYLHFAHHEYDRAQNLLMELRSHQTKYSESDELSIKWFLDESNKDFDPRANALRLLAVSLSIENSEVFYSRMPDLNSEYIISVYSSYLRQKGRIPQEFFPEDREIWLYNRLINNDRRYEELLGELRKERGVSLKELSVHLKEGRAGVHNFFSSKRRESLRFIRSETSIISGGWVYDNFREIYEIACAFRRSKEDKEIGPMIDGFFEKLGLGKSENPREDFISLLTAARSLSRAQYVSDASLFILNLLSLEKELPKWDKLISAIHHNLDRKPPVDEIYKNYILPLYGDLGGLNKFSHTKYEIFHDAIGGGGGVVPVPEFKKSTSIMKTALLGSIDYKTIESEDDVFPFNLGIGIKSKDELKTLIVDSEFSDKVKGQIRQSGDGLKQVFTLNSVQKSLKNDESILLSLENLKLSIDKKIDRDIEQKHLELSSEEALKLFKSEMINLHKSMENKIEIRHSQVMELLNKKSESWVDNAKRKINKSAGIRKEVTMQTLLQAFATKNFSGIQEYNPSLLEPDIKVLAGLVKSYLIDVTYKHKLEDLIRFSTEILKTKNNWDEKLKQSELLSFQSAILQTREYRIDEHPEYLVFEYTMEFLIRKEQCRALETLNMKEQVKENPATLGALYELIMGSGKTSVLLPLSAYQNSDENTLSIVVLPERLIPTMAQQLNEQMAKVFGSNAEVIEVRREYKFDDAKIQTIKVRLEQAMAQHKVVVLSNSSVQSLFLLFIDAMKSGEGSGKISQIRIFRDIFKFLHDHAHVIVDEADSILDIMKAHRFSIGEPVPFNKDAFFASIGLYGLIIGDPGLSSEASLAFLATGENKSEKIFIPSYYHSYLKNKIISRLVERSSIDLLFFHNFEKSIRDLYRELDPVGLEKFLKSEDPQYNQNFLNEVEDPLFRGFLATLYTQINLILPLTLDRLYKIHYGLYPKSACKSSGYCPEFIAIPYHSGTPLKNSRFESDLEALNYAIQSHIEERNSQVALERKLNHFKNNWAMTKGKKRREQLKKDILEFFPNKLIEDILAMHTKDVAPFAASVNRNPMLLLKLYVEPLQAQLTIFDEQISTNALIYTSLFKKIQGFSGTLWNYQTFAPFFDENDKGKLVLSKTLENTLSILWSKSRSKVDILPDSKLASEVSPHDKIREKVKEIFAHNPIGPVIDQGGLFKGFDNEDVARAILDEKESQYSRIIFYDSHDNLKIYNSKDSSVKDFISSNNDRNVTIAFWDLQHCTGSDLKIAKEAKAVLVLNKNSIMRDLTQSAWRLRNLHLGQTVNFAIQKYDADYISEYLKENYRRGQSLDLSEVLFYTFVREKALVQDQIHRSIQLGMENSFIDEMIKYMMEKDLSDKAFLSLYDSTRSLFEQVLPPYSYTVYGKPLVFAPKASVLSHARLSLMQSPMLIKLGGSVMNRMRIKEKIDGLEEKGLRLLPPFLLSQAIKLETAVEVETELEMELENQIEQEVELDIELYTSSESHNVRIRWLWEEEKFWSGEYFRKFLVPEDRKRPWNILRKKNKTKWVDSNLKPIPNASYPIFISLADALRTDQLSSEQKWTNKDDIANALDSEILISMNASSVFDLNCWEFDISAGIPRKLDTQASKFFSTNQKEFNDVLVILSESGEIRNLAIIDREESHEMGEIIRNNSTPHEGMFLRYNLSGGHFDRLDLNARKNIEKEPLFLERISSNQKFVKWIAQIKFISGRVSYTSKELSSIEHWLDKFPVLVDSFEIEILRYKQKARTDFKESPLSDIIDKKRKKIHNSKIYDQTLLLGSDNPKTRESAKNFLISAISDSKKQPETVRELVGFLGIFYSNMENIVNIDNTKLSDALEIHTALLQKGIGKELAARVLPALDQRNERNIRMPSSFYLFKFNTIKGEKSVNQVLEDFAERIVDSEYLPKDLNDLTTFISLSPGFSAEEGTSIVDLYSLILKGVHLKYDGFNKDTSVKNSLKLLFLSIYSHREIWSRFQKKIIDLLLKCSNSDDCKIAVETQCLLVDMRLKTSFISKTKREELLSYLKSNPEDDVPTAITRSLSVIDNTCLEGYWPLSFKKSKVHSEAQKKEPRAESDEICDGISESPGETCTPP